jgi:hypothetical protein
MTVPKIIAISNKPTRTSPKTNRPLRFYTGFPEADSLISLAAAFTFTIRQNRQINMRSS